MRRLTPRQYDRRASISMCAYVALMVLVWPLVRGTPATGIKFLLAVVPVLPMLYVIGLMALRIRYSDELEQRTHLVALGAATAVVGALSLVGGFLAAGKVVALDGSILIWVFPALVMVYGSTRWWVMTRLYGGAPDCDDGHAPMWRRMLLVAALMGFVGLAAWWKGDRDPFRLGMLCGMGASLLVAALVVLFRRRRKLP
ncbi:hypothetical protein [Fulvimonas soli]|uniref:Uncharacterized protein n=1 Tax=Fulvimonas soli TaxID=155197 RepID=A0A316I2Z0_9GAMM|nr:hypothetical protein [Fulvimonas soli]PWK86736.1 hypothetical protein C7456_107127 [Fulvimonas soli]TNY27068.1 hypothetical protein BV497_05280 [Fulvimonas soli]